LWEPNGCTADFDYDSLRTAADLLVLLSGYGTAEPTVDLDGDGVCATSDLLIFLTVFGSGCD
jgi:hypothetical protein